MHVFVEFTRPLYKTLPLFSYIIRAVERTPYSHVRLRWVNSVGVPVVYESTAASCRFLGPEAQQQFQAEALKRYILELNREQYRELVKVCMEKAGTDYGYLQLIGILIARVFRLKSNPLSHGRDKQVCSELVAEIIKRVLKLDTGKDLDIIGPRDIDRFLQENL